LIALKREVVEFSGAVVLTPTLRASSFCFRVFLVPLGKLHVRVHLNGRSRSDSGERVDARFGGSDEADDSVVATVALGWG